MLDSYWFIDIVENLWMSEVWILRFDIVILLYFKSQRTEKQWIFFSNEPQFSKFEEWNYGYCWSPILKISKLVLFQIKFLLKEDSNTAYLERMNLNEYLERMNLNEYQKRFKCKSLFFVQSLVHTQVSKNWKYLHVHHQEQQEFHCSNV